MQNFNNFLNTFYDTHVYLIDTRYTVQFKYIINSKILSTIGITCIALKNKVLTKDILEALLYISMDFFLTRVYPILRVSHN